MTGLFIITFVLQAFEIPSSSMENTLLIGDHVFVNRVLFAPGHALDGAAASLSGNTAAEHRGLSFARRAGSLRGQAGHRSSRETASICAMAWCYRNGEKLDEPYVIHNSDEGPNEYRDNFPAVPPSDYNRLFPDWQQSSAAIHPGR